TALAASPVDVAVILVPFSGSYSRQEITRGLKALATGTVAAMSSPPATICLDLRHAAIDEQLDAGDVAAGRPRRGTRRRSPPRPACPSGPAARRRRGPPWPPRLAPASDRPCCRWAFRWARD